MKTLNFLYQETQIHFLINGTDQNVMVNATEMAKLFGRRTKDFLKTDHAKAFIKVAERALNGARSDSKIIDNRGHVGIYFERRLALKFAAWLSPEFEYWVFSTLDEIIFGNYKKHWEAHAKQEQAKAEMKELKEKIIKDPTPETVVAFFEAENKVKLYKGEKTKAINNQLKLFPELEQ